MKIGSGIYSKSFESNSWYSSSLHEPVAMTKNLRSSAFEFLPQPSDMFVGIDELDLRICEINPYVSSFGKDVFVIE